MSFAQYLALAERKARLLERIDAQRGELAAHGAALKKPLALADKVVQATHYVKQRPWVAGVGALAVVILSRRNLFRWVGRGWTMWRGWRFATRWLHEQGYLKN